MTETFILALLDKFDGTSARELEYTDGAARLFVSKDRRPSAAAAPAGTAPDGNAPLSAGTGIALPGNAPHATGNAPPPPGNAPPSGYAPPAPASAAAAVQTISAPIVGTYYAAPGPDSPAFVSVGSRVKKGETLCILEAMKMMNKLEAEFDCEIVSIKVRPGELVEFGQPLFEVRPA